MFPPILKKTAIACAVVYVGALPVSFVVGGFLFSRPLRSPLKTEDIVAAVRPEWDRSFLSLMRAVEIPLRPRVRLRGTIFPAGARSTVIVLHSLGENRLEGVEAAYALWESGVDVLLIDRAAHGRSDGDTRPLFGGESEELRAVVNELVKNDWTGTSTIGVFGIGDGGTAALVAAANDPRIDAVCAENPALTASDFVHATFSRWAPLPDFLLAPPAMLSVLGMRIASDLESSEFDASAPLSRLGIPTQIISIGADARSEARGTYQQIPAGIATMEEVVDRPSAYAAMCRFFDQGL